MTDDALILRVSESLPRDVGKGIARMDPKDIESIGVGVGDIVEVAGKRATVAKVMPAFMEARDRKLVQIDGIIRENAQAGIDEKVQVKKIAARPATRILLAPLTLMRSPQRDADSRYIGKLLQGLPTVQGDRIRATLFGSHYQEFTVASTVPDGPVVIQPTTLLSLSREERTSGRKRYMTSYEDIGGLHKEIQKVREMIELPMKYPQIFERLGIEPPKGVLLHGPPGTGKTLIARAVANETDAHFISVSGPEVIHKFYGESEAKLRSIFEQAAKNAPSIVFLDEIDAIAPKRETVVGEVEKRVVAQLLALMDGLQSRGQVIVIGASVTGDTPVLVKGRGLVPIAELVDPYYGHGEEGKQIPVHDLEVLGYEPRGNDPRREARRFVCAKFQSVHAVFRHRVDEIYEIEFTGKHRIRVTADHSLFVRGHGGVKPMRAIDLRPGDMLVGLPYSAYMRGMFSRAAKFEPEIPDVLGSGLDEKTAYLLGLWLAEGYIRDGKTIDFCISENEVHLAQRVKAWAKRLGRIVYNHPTQAGGALNIGFTYAELARFIAENFGTGAHGKRLPGWAFMLPYHLFLAMLSGWVDGDGWCGTDGRVEVATTSRELAIGMLWACRMHNIWTSMSSYHYTGFGSGVAYRLRFSKANSPWNNDPGQKHAKRVQPKVKSVRNLPFEGYVYDLCGCAGEAFYGGEMPILLHNTNIPNVLDPALRRPGRFDREISIGIPDKNGRLETLQIHTRGMPLREDVDLERIAQTTHGFVGADLQALCREAAMICLRKILPNIDFNLDTIPYEDLLELEVTMDDFMGALKEVEPSVIREVFTEIPDVRWEDIGGLEEVKRDLIEAVEWPLKYPELFRHTGTEMTNGVLLYGPPGTGKTLLAKAVATENEVNFISIKGPALLSKWVGESEKGIRDIFKKAKQAAPCVVFFDEIDSIAPARSGLGTDSHVTERVVSQLLTEMDGIEKSLGVMVLAATNRLDIVDPALLRPGRFDLLIEIPSPDRNARIDILHVHTQGKPLAGDVDVEALADLTDGSVGADLQFMCTRASLLAIRRFLHSGTSENRDVSELTIRMEDFREAILAMKPPGG